MRKRVPKPPQYTQVPNDVLDNLPAFSESELKCYLAIVRVTVGYHKRRKKMSLSYLQLVTGLSKTSVIGAVQALIDAGLIARVRHGNSFYYEPIFYESDENGSKSEHTEDDGEGETVQNLDRSGSKFGQKTVQNLDTLKDKRKPEKKRGNTPANAGGADAPRAGDEQHPPFKTETSKPKKARNSKNTRARKNKDNVVPAEVLRSVVTAWAVVTGLIPDDQAEVPSTVYPRLAREAKRALTAKRKQMGGAADWQAVGEALRTDLHEVYRGWWAWDGRETAPNHAQVHELLARVWAGTWPPKGRGRRGRKQKQAASVDELAEAIGI